MSLRHRVPKFFVHFYVKKKKVLLCLKTVVVTVICSNNPNICITLWAVGCEWRSGWSSKKERGKKAHIAPTPPLHPRQLPKSSEFVDNWQQASAAWTFGKWNLFVCRVKKSGSVWKTVCVCGGGAFRWGIKKAKSKKFVQSLHRCPRAPVQKASVQSEQRAVCAAQTWHLSSTPWRLYWRLSFCKVVHRLISMTRKWSQSWPGWSRESYRCSPHDRDTGPASWRLSFYRCPSAFWPRCICVIWQRVFGVVASTVCIAKCCTASIQRRSHVQ